MPLQVGDLAPDFTLVDETGAKVQLSTLRGQNVVLVFYPLDFSPTCTKELHAITANKAKYDASHARVFGISVDSRWTHAAFKRDEGLSATLLADFNPKGAVAQQYGAWFEPAGFAMRATFIVDKDGVIRGITMNGPGDARDEAKYFEALAHCPV